MEVVDKNLMDVMHLLNKVALLVDEATTCPIPVYSLTLDMTQLSR